MVGVVQILFAVTSNHRSGVAGALGDVAVTRRRLRRRGGRGGGGTVVWRAPVAQVAARVAARGWVKKAVGIVGMGNALNYDAFLRMDLVSYFIFFNLFWLE